MTFLKYVGAFIFWFMANIYYTSVAATPNVYERLGSWILGSLPEPGDGGFNALIGLVIMFVLSVLLAYASVKGITKFLDSQRKKPSSF